MYPNLYELECKTRAQQKNLLQEAQRSQLLRQLPSPLKSWLAAQLYRLAHTSERAAERLETQTNLA